MWIECGYPERWRGLRKSRCTFGPILWSKKVQGIQSCFSVPEVLNSATPGAVAEGWQGLRPRRGVPKLQSLRSVAARVIPSAAHPFAAKAPRCNVPRRRPAVTGSTKKGRVCWYELAGRRNRCCRSERWSKSPARNRRPPIEQGSLSKRRAETRTMRRAADPTRKTRARTTRRWRLETDRGKGGRGC
jgi:hypothetical protein